MSMHSIGQYNYREEDILGQGGAGRVYYGYHVKTGLPVAIKKQLDLANASKEAKIMKKLRSHRYVLKMYDYIIHQEMGYLICEYVDGKNIGIKENGYLYKTQPYSTKDAISVTIKLLKALEHIHSSGYTHRDIAPNNILVLNRSHNSIKVIDFGSTISQKQYSSRADLMRAARMLIFLSNGEMDKLTFKSRKADPSIIPMFQNKQLVKVLKKALHPNPKKRYQSARSFIKALKPIYKLEKEEFIFSLFY